jgi:hypothetical protein
MKKSSSKQGKGGDSPSHLIEARTSELPDWRDEMLSRIRRLIEQADPEASEEVKWRKPSNPMGVPVWSHDGIICTGETYKDKVKLTFAKGASLKDPSGLFNASLEGNIRRAIDFHEGDKVDKKALKALIRAAVALNTSSIPQSTGTKAGTNPSAGKTPGKPAKDAKQPSARRGAARPALLAGGNPQIAKADGDPPVQAYIAAMPGWKSGLGRRLDALIVRTVPGVRKAVKWNSPFYGIEGQGWFLSFHVFTRYVKVTFFSGTSLRPIPPGGTPKSRDARWIDIFEDDQLDEAQFAKWVKQAAALPGWVP